MTDKVVAFVPYDQSQYLDPVLLEVGFVPDTPILPIGIGSVSPAGSPRDTCLLLLEDSVPGKDIGEQVRVHLADCGTVRVWTHRAMNNGRHRAVEKVCPPGACVSRHSYHREAIDPFCAALVAFLKSRTEADFDRLIHVKEEGYLAKAITGFKHRIAHLFVPLDIDLQRLEEIKEDEDDEDDSVSHLKDVLGSRGGTFPFQRKLWALHYLLVGECTCESCTLGEVDAELAPKSAAAWGSLIQFVTSEIGQGGAACDQWLKVLGIAGLTGNDKCGPVGAEACDIIKFMRQLDGLKADMESRELGIHHVNTALPISVATAGELKMHRFHDWVDALDSRLHDLRDAVLRPAQDQV